MAIFNESYLSILNEKKSREEYHRDSFKKKYKFEPDKPGSHTGTITDPSDGKKYKVDMNKNNRSTQARLVSGEGVPDIELDKNFFKVKGSNKSERRDALINHEIGHKKLHSANVDDDKIENKNKSPKVAKQILGNISGNLYTDLYDKDERKDVYDNILKFNKYGEILSKDKEHRKEREKAYEHAKKYDNGGVHTKPEEFEADRYAANRTSEHAVKRGMRDMGKNVTKSIKDPEIKKYYNGIIQNDMNQRSKALKDDEMRKNKIYK